MRPLGNHSRRKALVAAALIAVFLHACTRWTAVPLEPAQAPAAGPVRATLRTGQHVIIRSPVISGDTLREASTEGVRWSQPRPRPGIPLAQITALEVQKTDAVATVGVVVIGGLAVGGLIVFAVLKSVEAGWE
jgi:hypothetical protein